MRRKKVTVPRQRIKTPLAPAAIGPYCQAMLVGDTLYVSGQIAIDPQTSQLSTEGVEIQAEQVLDNVGAVLRAAGMDYHHVVRCTVFLADIHDYAQVNEVYARYFSDNAPTRETIQAAALPRGARVEISCTAVR
ncbi:MAG: 2-iminobutanoate/2-iminopropanoate deaminase [Rhodothermales bacterium]|jgi:2-iminobutanoate/2-iminopropanoate deaminase